MKDILQEATQEEMPKILDVLKKDWPKHFLLHQYITMMEEYRSAGVENPKQALYRYGHFEEGVYLVETVFSVSQMQHSSFFVYTTSTDLTDLSEVLKKTSRIPWQLKGLIFLGTCTQFTPAIVEASTSRGLNLKVDKNFMLIYPPDENLDMRNLPDDTFLAFLDETHIPEIDKNWPHRDPVSEEYLRLQLKNNFGLGLFRKCDSKMLSSSLSFHNGGIFVLYSDEEFRGKGCAEIIVRSMVKEIRKRGRIPFCTIREINIPSQNLFRKIGFIDVVKVDYIYP